MTWRNVGGVSFSDKYAGRALSSLTPTTAVSYTHLDVYKRQDAGSLSRGVL